MTCSTQEWSQLPHCEVMETPFLVSVTVSQSNSARQKKLKNKSHIKICALCWSLHRSTFKMATRSPDRKKAKHQDASFLSSSSDQSSGNGANDTTNRTTGRPAVNKRKDRDSPASGAARNPSIRSRLKAARAKNKNNKPRNNNKKKKNKKTKGIVAFLRKKGGKKKQKH